MSFTRFQIAARIQNNLNDITGTYFDPQFVNDSIQDQYDEIALSTQCIEFQVQVPFVAGQLYYDLYNILINPGFWRFSRVFNNNTNRWLPIVDSRELDKYRFDWELTSGTPWFGYIVNYRWLAFFPHYTTGTGLQPFDLFCKSGRDFLSSDNSIIQIPGPYIESLEKACTADLLEAIGEINKSAALWNDYSTILNALKSYVANRMMPDLHLQLNDLNFPYPTMP